MKENKTLPSEEVAFVKKSWTYRYNTTWSFIIFEISTEKNHNLNLKLMNKKICFIPVLEIWLREMKRRKKRSYKDHFKLFILCKKGIKMDNSPRCDICIVDDDGSSFAKHLWSKNVEKKWDKLIRLYQIDYFKNKNLIKVYHKKITLKY